MPHVTRGGRLLLWALLVALLLPLLAWLWIPWDGPPYDDVDLKSYERPFPASENGWNLLAQAGDKVALQRNERDELRTLLARGDPLSTQADLPLARLETALPLFRQAMARPRCVGPAGRSLADTVAYVLPQVDLGLLLSLRAARLALRGKAAEALDALSEVLDYAWRFERESSELVFHSLGLLLLTNAQRACDVLQERGGLSAAQERRLAALLRAKETDATGFRRAWRHQFALSAQLVDSLAEVERLPLGWGDRLPAWLRRLTIMRLYHPQDSKRELAQIHRLQLREADEPLARRGFAADHLRELTADLEGRKHPGMLFVPNVLGRFFVALHSMDMRNLARIRARCLADQRLAEAVSLLRSARRERGHWPADWREAGCVAPLDPFDGAPLRWDPARGIVYSVGANLRDDGGSLAPTGPLSGWPARDALQREDMVRQVRP